MSCRRNRDGKKTDSAKQAHPKSGADDTASGTSLVSHRRASSSTPSDEEDQMGRENEPASLAIILKELRSFREDTTRRLGDIKEEVTQMKARLDQVETVVGENERNIQNVDEIMADMLRVQERLQNKLTGLEAYSRRETLRIYGIPEGSENDSPSMAQFVEKMLRDNLAIPPATELQIQRAHRALSAPPPSGAQPRSVLVKFLCFTVKEEVLKLAWQKRGFVWKNSQINFDNDYPPEILAMRKEYTEARRALKDKKIRFQTLYPARLRVFHEDGTKTYDTVEEATADLSRRGLQLTVVPQPQTIREKLQRWSSWQPVKSRATQRGKGTLTPVEKLQVFRRR